MWHESILGEILRLGKPQRARAQLSDMLDLAGKIGYLRPILDIPEFASLLADLEHPESAVWLAKFHLELGVLHLPDLTRQDQSVLQLLARTLVIMRLPTNSHQPQHRKNTHAPYVPQIECEPVHADNRIGYRGQVDLIPTTRHKERKANLCTM